MKFEENISYAGWPDCIRLANEEMEIIVATGFGLRILRLGFINGQNFFHLFPAEKEKTQNNQWKIYGGHRLWHAPEAMPRTYCPDNDPISYQYNAAENTLTITQPKETATGIIKEMQIRLSRDKNQLTVIHRLYNQNLWNIKLSPWALSVLAKNGRAIIPQEPFGEGDDYLLPARSIALWQYTRMDDERWVWGNKYIQARQDPSKSSEQKIGVMNKRGWSAYCLHSEILIKLFKFDALSEYPDLGSNNEIYINGEFLEMETLGPVVNISPGGMTEHEEVWLITRGNVGYTEASVDTIILPAVLALQREVGEI